MPTAVVREGTSADAPACLALFESVAAEGRWIGRELPIDADALLRSSAAFTGDRRYGVHWLSAEPRPFQPGVRLFEFVST